tara:strand:+ start:266 stop:1597 length:1332 start_codon:yes stop_codon:yes gene_type:complete
MELNNNIKLHILGGGPAGLATGYYAKKNNIPLMLYEGSNEVGGNCKTIVQGQYRYDTGAHRFHDKYDLVTDEIKNLVGDDLRKVNSPSKIFFKDRMINFPLDLTSLFTSLDRQTLKKIFTEKIYHIFKHSKEPTNFKDLAYQTYGKTLSELFLINYTEKLWGKPAENLDVLISGNRLKNLNMSTMLRELIFRSGETAHLDGSFYYPKYGFGTIFEKMKDYIGENNIRFDSPISKIIHNGEKIVEVVYGQSRSTNIEKVISTLPLNILINAIEPSPPDQIKKLVNNIKYRGLKLCIIYLDMPFFTKNASIYFPESKFPFTRIYEPKNRSKYMAPKDKTCIVIETPYDQDHSQSGGLDEQHFSIISNALIKKNLIKKDQIISHDLLDIRYAYPILDIDLEGDLKKILSYLSNFENMYLIGRSAEFKYIHTHDIINQAKTVISKII